jgi:hypothetical protein
MEQQQLEELNKESLKKLEEFVEKKGPLKQEHHEELHKAKDEWQAAWIKLREVLMVLERLEL